MNHLKISTLGMILLFSATAVRAEGPSRRERLLWAAQAQDDVHRKDFEAAAQKLEKSVSAGASKKDLVVWLPVLGRCHEATKNYQKALAVYQKAYQLRPKLMERMLDLARLYALTDLSEPAVDLYQQILLKQERKDVVWALANLYFKTGQIGLAKEQAENYLRREPRDISAQRLMARIEEILGELSSAARRREGILKQEPSADGYLELGRLWMRQNQYDLAEAALGQAGSLGLDSASFHCLRGLAAWRRGEDAKAEDLWKKALEKDPGWTLARFFLALGEFEKGQGGSAVQLMSQVKTEATNDYMKELASAFIDTAVHP